MEFHFVRIDSTAGRMPDDSRFDCSLGVSGCLNPCNESTYLVSIEVPRPSECSIVQFQSGEKLDLRFDISVLKQVSRVTSTLCDCNGDFDRTRGGQ